jgi:UDP-N-acetylglucosamine--N-acetylmuramyl-(pentapeptide) pyrophosphoryl-undecaprenol N-acetylglucosamine transferase
MRLMLCCSELGLGHVSRIISLGRKLREKGHELFFFSGGKAYALLQKEFRNVYPCTPVAWYENASGIVASASLINILFPLPVFNHERNTFKIKSSTAMETVHRYYDLRRQIRKIKPDIVVADGDLHALRMAARWKFPAVYIANMIRPSYGFSAVLNPGERFIERYVKTCAKIIIPDNPPPYTVCEYNLGDLDSIGISEKTEFVGSFLDTTYTQGSEEHVFAPISGPYGTRAKLTQMILPVLEELETKSVISLGTPNKKIDMRKGNCEIHAWLSSQERQKSMRNAKLIVFSGGHMSCFETVKYAKPSICIPTQPEQMGNAAKLQKLHCSISVKNRQELKAAVQKIEAKRPRFRKSIMALNTFSSKFNGVGRAVEIIESIVK